MVVLDRCTAEPLRAPSCKGGLKCRNGHNPEVRSLRGYARPCHLFVFSALVKATLWADGLETFKQSYSTEVHNPPA